MWGFGSGTCVYQGACSRTSSEPGALGRCAHGLGHNQHISWGALGHNQHISWGAPPFLTRKCIGCALLRSPFPSFWPRTLLTKQPHASTRLYECVDGIRCAFGQHYPSSRCVRPTPVCMRTLLKSASQTCVEICKSNMPCCSSVAGVRGRWRFPPGLPAVSGCTL